MSKFYIILLFFTSLLWGQIQFVELPQVPVTNYFPDGRAADFRSFDSDWFVYKNETPDKRLKIELPAVFDKEESFVFEKEFELNETAKGKNIIIHFMGINYTADFTLNDIVVYRHTGGEFPVSVHLPNNLLNFDSKNTLKVTVNYFEDSDITIPLAQKFLFPRSFGGFLRDAYLEISEPFTIEKIKTDFAFDYKRKSTTINFKINFLLEETVADTISTDGFELGIRVYNGAELLAEKQFPLSTKQKSKEYSLKFNSLFQWTPENPAFLKSEIILKKQGRILQERRRFLYPYELYATENGLRLNGTKFQIKGTVLLPLEKFDKKRTAYFRKQVELIKNTGMNFVRFSKKLPDPYLIKLLSDEGILSFVDIPIDGVPENLSEKEDFRKRVFDYASQTINYYSQFDCVAGFGLGSSYISNSELHRNFLEEMTARLRKSTDKIIYASFIGQPEFSIDGLDLYGMQFYAVPVTDIMNRFSEAAIPEGRLFISESIYPAMYGKSNGYLNEFTVEAQSKYFADLITHSARNGNNGYFINSFFDYKGKASSLFAGYSKEHIYSLGIQKAPESPLSFTAKVIKSKLTGDGKINIPLGTKNDRSPIFFVIVALILAIIMGILVNTKRKFREDATRALLRSYNFYADIRDHRILSGVHTFILMIVIAGTHSLLWTVLLYFLRMNILFEKIILSFEIDWLSNLFSYLAWNPVNTFAIGFAVSIAGFLLLSLVIKAFSIFVKQRVLFSNIYYVVVWSFLPIVLLLPVELVLHKVLLLNMVNIYIYAILAITLFWFIGRLLKGVYVIYDVSPSAVYLYALGLLLVLGGTIILYFHISSNTFGYLITALKQHPLI